MLLIYIKKLRTLTSFLFLALNKLRLSLLETDSEVHKQAVLLLLYKEIGINIKQRVVLKQKCHHR